MSTKLIVSILVLVGGLLIASLAQASVDWSIVGTADGESDLIGTVTTPDIPVSCTSSPSFCEVSGTLTFAAGALGGPGTTFDLASDPDIVTAAISASPPAAGDNFNLFDMTRDGYYCDGSTPFTLICEYDFENTTEFVLQLAPPSVAIGNGNVLITGQFLANGQPINPPPKQYAVGDRGPANGWVFYVTDDGLHGLEAAPEDLSLDGPTTTEIFNWGCHGIELTGADGTDLGTGASNTDDILRDCTSGALAAVTAAGYVSPSGYFDWYLPSKDELDLMYMRIGPGNTSDPNVGGFTTFIHWSSSEVDNNNAWAQEFLSGDPLSRDKDESHRVRAIRAF